MSNSYLIGISMLFVPVGLFLLWAFFTFLRRTWKIDGPKVFFLTVGGIAYAVLALYLVASA